MTVDKYVKIIPFSSSIPPSLFSSFSPAFCISFHPIMTQFVRGSFNKVYTWYISTFLFASALFLLRPFTLLLSGCYIFCYKTALRLLQKRLLVLLISETAHQRYAPCFVKAIRDQSHLSGIYRKPLKISERCSIFRCVTLNENSTFRGAIFSGARIHHHKVH